jgi:HK97 family phage prohead protease
MFPLMVCGMLSSMQKPTDRRAKAERARAAIPSYRSEGRGAFVCARRCPVEDESPVHEEEIAANTFRVSFDRHAAQLLADEPGMSGYAARFGVVTDRGTVFARSAFNKTAQEQASTPHLYQHWPDLIIGVNKAQKPDSKGFPIKAVLNESDDLAARVMGIYRFGRQHGWMPGWSVGFDRIKDRPATHEEFAGFDFTGAPSYKNSPAGDIRVITEAKLWEVSTVTWPALHNAGPDVVHRRGAFATADLTALQTVLREGLLPEDQLIQLSQLIAARQTRAGADASHSTPPVPSQRDIDADLELFLFVAGQRTEQAA